VILWSLCFLFTLISGIVFIRLGNKKNLMS
jgi:uncharacterized membrane protein